MIFLYSLLAVLGLHCWAALSLVAGAPLAGDHRRWGEWASATVARRLSCSKACGILLNHNSNPCPLLWQADSYPLPHQGGTCQTISCIYLMYLSIFSIGDTAVAWAIDTCLDGGYPGEGNTCSRILIWRIPMLRGAWWAIVHGVSKSQTRLSD